MIAVVATLLALATVQTTAAVRPRADRHSRSKSAPRLAMTTSSLVIPSSKSIGSSSTANPTG